MGSPEAKGQPAMPKGAVPARVGVYSTRGSPFMPPPPPPDTQTFSQSRPVSVLTWPRSPASSTEEHTLPLTQASPGPFAPVISHADTAFHICEGTLTQDFQPLGSGHCPVFLLRPHPLLLHRSGGNNLEGPAFRQSSGSCCLSADQATDSRGEGRGCQTRGTLSLGPEVHLSLVCSSNANSPFSPLLEWVRGSQCS